MQRRLSAFANYTIESPDGKVGYISDALFEDDHWKIRWFVINVGSWLFGHKLLIRPAALGRPDIRQRAFPVTLTKAEVEASPDISSDPPVFRQMEHGMKTVDTYVPIWDIGAFGGYSVGSSDFAIYNERETQQYHAMTNGDLHLRSGGQVIGYGIYALDGDIGHLEDFLMNDETWQIEYALVDTKNWGSGKHILIPVTDIMAIDWAGKYIRIDRTRYDIKSGPSWRKPDLSVRPVP